MRIVLTGQGPFGADVLKKLSGDKGNEVAGVFTPPGKRGDPLQEAAGAAGIPLVRAASMKAPAIYEQCVKLRPELGVMAFVTDIVPLKFIQCPRLGTIQYHPSLLPKHRGGSAINWAIINGDARTGLTIFWPDAGIDTGPVLLQKEVEITPDDTTGSVYFNKLYPLGVAAMVEAVNMVKQGAAPRIAQDESQATYEGLCEDKVAGIDWSQPVQKVYNLVRGCDPQPGAHTTLNGKKLRIYDARLSPDKVKASPGEIVAISQDGITITASGGAIRAKRVQFDTAPKTDAFQFAQSVNLKAGMLLGK